MSLMASPSAAARALVLILPLIIAQSLKHDLEDSCEETYIVMPTETSQSQDPLHRRRYDVMSFGAAGDGVTDDTQAFADAWAAACQVSHSNLIIPSDKMFLVGPSSFSGPCGRNLSVKIDGKIVAPSSPSYWKNRGFNTGTWLVFDHLAYFTLEGNGIISGQGQEWWAQSCKIDKRNPCHSAPTAVTISNSNNIMVKTLTFKDSQQMHLKFEHCNKVHASYLLVTAPGNSPNTDGIHVHAGSEVVISDSVISTGDDCISIQTATSDTWMKNVTCGPGHGISIGSLGKDSSSAYVSNIFVDGAVLNNTTNGVRIKSWQGGRGAANNITFENIEMIDVANPIIIDQYYCDSSTPCQNQTSAVEISGITYRNITGTSSTATAVKFACSDTVACQDLLLQDVNLVTYNPLQRATSFCENAKGIAIGVINPKSCLSPSPLLSA